MASSKSNLISIRYQFAEQNEIELQDLLTEFESELGGTRAPYSIRGGAIDLVTFFEVTLGSFFYISLSQVLKKYAEGLWDADSFKQLGKTHRTQIEACCENLLEETSQIISVYERVINLGISFPRFRGFAECIALQFSLGNCQCYVVLNHFRMNSTLLNKIPIAIIDVVRYSLEQGLPSDTVVAQLYYDLNTGTWRYLFIPTTEGFGGFINRYIDLQDKTVKFVQSPQQFQSLFNIPVEETMQLIISHHFHYDGGL